MENGPRADTNLHLTGLFAKRSQKKPEGPKTETRRSQKNLGGPRKTQEECRGSQGKRTQKAPGARRTQKEPGGSQEDQRKPGGAWRNPGEARRSQEEPG